jgi:transcriptional regulator with XRE-family HTH domain
MKIETDCYWCYGHAIGMTDKEDRLVEFSQRFRRLLNEQGCANHRREDIGKQLGVKGPAVTYWWNGDRLPTMQQAIAISIEFNCCVEWLLTGRGSMRPQPLENDCLDISLLPDNEKAIFKAHIDARNHQIIAGKGPSYLVKQKSA